MGLLFVSQNPYAVGGRARNEESATVHKGEIYVRGEELIFSGLDARASMPLEGLRMKRNRWLGGAIEISHRSAPNWTFFTRNDKLLYDPAFQSRRSLVEFAADCRVHFYRLRRTFRNACLLLLLVMIFCAPARNYATQKVVRYIPVKTEVELGDSAFKEISNEIELVSDPHLIGELHRITERLVQSLPKEDKQFPFRFHIALNPDVNAFALPGGNIVVNSGLLIEAKNAEEIAGILGHEMGHVTGRHSMGRLCQGLGTLALFAAIFGSIESSPDAAFGMIVLKYSRDNETDADERALKYLCAARVNPEALASFFKRLAEANRAAKFPAADLLSTHPLPQDRAEALKKLIARSTTVSFTPIEMDYESFRNVIRERQAQRKIPVRVEKERR
jgi:beta-barrel assembly-enhancing protease